MKKKVSEKVFIFLIVIVAFVMMSAIHLLAQLEEEENETTGFWDNSSLTGKWGGIRSDLEEAGLSFDKQQATKCQGATFVFFSPGNNRSDFNERICYTQG